MYITNSLCPYYRFLWDIKTYQKHVKTYNKKGLTKPGFLSWCVCHHKSKTKWPSNQDISWKRLVSLSRYIRGDTWKLNVQLPIKLGNFWTDVTSFFPRCCSVRTCIRWKQVNWFLTYMAFNLHGCFFYAAGLKLETFLNWLKFVVNFFYCFVLLFVLFTDTIFDNFPRNHASFSEKALLVVFCH